MIKYITPFFSLCFLVLTFSSVAQNTASTPHSLEEAISLFNAGDHKKAQILLKQNLAYDPDDSDSRSVLGKMNYHLGEWQTAISIWSEGLNGKPSDYVFHLNIGNVFFEKAEQNAPSKFIRISSVQEADPNSEQSMALYEKDFLKFTSSSFLRYWQSGIDSYLSAYKIYPYEEYVLERLAELYEMNREFDKAFVYHKQLAELYPENSYYLTNAAIYQAKIKTTSQKAKDSLENLVIARLNYSLEIDNQNPETYKELARIAAKKESLDKNKEDSNQIKDSKSNSISLEWMKKADFYSALPQYARFEYSNEKALLLDRILTKNSSNKKNWSLLVDSLVNSLFMSEFKHVENSPEARITQNLLITILAADATDSKLPRTFDSYYSLFSERNNITSTLSESNYGQWLLIQLLEETKEIKLTKQITTTLVEKHVPNMYAILSELLEYDYMDESMEIAKNMAKLDDPRSKVKLISEIHLTLPITKTKDRNYYSIQTRQLRAILALATLEKEDEIKQELVQGLENQDIRFFCAVALYSQTRDADYLKLAKKYKPKKAFFPELGQFLKQFNNAKAQSLGDKLIKG